MNKEIRKNNKIFIIFILLSILINFFPLSSAKAIREEKNINSKMYELDDSSEYIIGESKPVYFPKVGQILINEKVISRGSKNGFLILNSGADKLILSYKKPQDLKNNPVDEWNVVEDKSKKVNNIELDKNIQYGALILQSSKDGKTWITDKKINNIFSYEDELEKIYEINSVQIQNGTYFRIMIAYKMGKKVGNSKILFINKPKYVYKNVLEVHEFYIINKNNSSDSSVVPKKYLGKKKKTRLDSGYSEQEKIEINDPHFGWDLGTFFVNGFTSESNKKEDSIPVFLKNAGDRVTLWFNLKQDINKLNGNENLIISSDENAADQDMDIPKMDFQKGALVIKHINKDNEDVDPIIYTNFLEANARTGADTKVYLFEEGDYSVSLNYEIKSKDKIINKIPQYHNYKIKFDFKIRNGNAMAFFKDIESGEELKNESVTENGFMIDFAASKYLEAYVMKSNLDPNKEGLITGDIRYNRPAKDGELYDKEGIYTVRVKNLYTDQETIKTIYVDKTSVFSNIYKAGKTIEELKKDISDGKLVNNNGNIEFVKLEEDNNKIEPTDVKEVISSETTKVEKATKNSEENLSKNNETGLAKTNKLFLIFLAVLVCIGAIAIFKYYKVKIKEK